MPRLDRGIQFLLIEYLSFMLCPAKKLRKTLVYKNGFSPFGLLCFCFDYAKNYQYDIGGVFETTIKSQFMKYNETDLYETVKEINGFRSTCVAHQEKQLTDLNVAKEGLITWVLGLYKIILRIIKLALDGKIMPA